MDEFVEVVHRCIDCEVEMTDENRYNSDKEVSYYICSVCMNKRIDLCSEDSRKKLKAMSGEDVHRCRVCDELLTDENWSPSFRITNNCICKKCHNERVRLWQKENPDKVKASSTRNNRKSGKLPMDENKNCPSFLGVYVAETLLKNIFKDVVMMPNNNPGYDFICNRDKLIDAKSSCINKSGGWKFNINYNVIADFFVCVAFDNREDLNVLHVWMVPGSVVNHLKSVRICPSTIHKWDQYKLDVDKASSCCNEMKDAAKAH